MPSRVPTGISPELLKVLHEVGCGGTLVIGDVNFPAASITAEKNHINIRCDGHRVTDMLDAILQLMPLDGFAKKPITIMDKMEMHRDFRCPVWDESMDIMAKHDERGADAVGFLDRFAFYDATKGVYAVVSTSEAAFYACIVVQKGCLQRQSGGILHA